MQDQLQHYGIPGMRWGRRKTNSVETPKQKVRISRIKSTMDKEPAKDFSYKKLAVYEILGASMAMPLAPLYVVRHVSRKIRNNKKHK